MNKSITENERDVRVKQEDDVSLQSIINSVPVVISYFDREQRFRFANRASQQYLGKSPADLYGKTLCQILGKKAYKIAGKFAERALAGESVSFNNSLPLEDGGKISIQVSYTPQYSPDGQVKGFCAVVENVSNHVQTADALRTSEQRLQTLLNALPFMIAYIDTKFCFRFNNRAYETWFGRRGDDMYGRHVKDVAGEAAFANIHDYMDRALSGATVVYETSLPYNDGNERDVLVTYIPDFENGGSVKGFHVLIEDVSARNAAERMKNEFVSSVSHELRTPLTSIHDALRLIASGSLGEVPSQSRDMIELAERNSERLIYLVSDLLDIEKIGSGAMEFEFSAVDLTGLVRDAISLNQGLAESYSVDFRLSEPDSEIMVWADRNRLGQVLGNLLSNAAKFSPRGGEVEMSVTHHDGQARVAVSDHGPGISDDFKNSDL